MRDADTKARMADLMEAKALEEQVSLLPGRDFWSLPSSCGWGSGGSASWMGPTVPGVAARLLEEWGPSQLMCRSLRQ